MDILVIGGTIFLGRHIVDSALAQGHSVTIFHRGTHPNPFGDRVKEVLGDREKDLALLTTRNFDAVVDTCAYFPDTVARTADALRGHTHHYTFISTISVYADLSSPNVREDAQLAELSDPTVRQITGETYGGLKVLCEKEARDGFGDNTLVIRPGLIVGPNDVTARFTYWPRRIRQGGTVLVPGEKDAPVQCIDVRDLAAFTVKQVEQRTKGTVHVTGPLTPVTMNEFIATCAQVTGSDAEFVWVDETELEALVGERQIPMWLPREYHNLNRMDLTLARSMGLTTRPMEETISDTLAWADKDNGASERAGAFLTLDEERLALERRAAV